MRTSIACATLATAALAGCATSLTDAGALVRVVSEQEKRNCQFLRLVTTTAQFGDDKPGSAMRSALNETAAAGGNGFYPIVDHRDRQDSAAVSGEALTCVR